MPGKIFVNYRRDDSAAHALNVAQYLERTFGARNVFLDIDRMRAGQNFPDVLQDKLSACRVMIAVIGPSWLTLATDDGTRRIDDPEDWVRLEIAHALKRNIAVIPILVGGATLPKKSDLPDDLKPLLQRHIATITTNGFRNEMAGLTRDIKAIPQPAPWAKLSAAAVAACFVIFAGWYWTQQPATAPWSPTAIQRDTDAASKAVSEARVIAQSDALKAEEIKADEDRKRVEAQADAKRKADESEKQRQTAAKAEEERKRNEAQKDASRKADLERKSSIAKYGPTASTESTRNRVIAFAYRTPPQEIDPGLRLFKRQADGIWTNTYPSGFVERGGEQTRINLDGCTGAVIGKDTEPDFVIFIPDKGCPGMMLRFKRGNAPWIVFGHMENVR
ncbi:MAG: TIR domain-containing protein [Hyphomicrobiaceae bacterium]